MNDRHPAGTATPPAAPQEAAPSPFGSYDQGTQHGGYGGYDGHSSSSFTTTFAADPLFGDMAAPADTTGAYDTGSWGTVADAGTHASLNYDAYAAQHHTYDTGATGSYTTTGTWDVPAYPLGGIPEQQLPEAADTGQWQTQQFTGATYDTRTFAAQEYDSGTYDATAWNSGGPAPSYGEYGEHGEHGEYEQPVAPQESYAEPERVAFAQQETICGPLDLYGDSGADATTVLPEVVPADGPPAPGRPGGLPPEGGADHHHPDAAPVVLSRRAAPASRSRRRPPAKRSALLTVAVPSACVMGVAGIAAASVTMASDGDSKEKTVAAPDPTAVKPSVANNKLDSQIAGLSADAGDFADRASRTQERIDLKAKQEADRKKAAEAAALKERLRPKFMLPVKQNGLSAYYGQAGINWMSLHSGIDFPVGYGTPVMAATDGTVRTQVHSAYGNMVIVTAKDGTETWYCHLSRYGIVNGPVKAGDVIGYAGDSGNSTGPHLHFEVRPGGGSPVDPLAWFRSHGLDPT
ncbi:M23 family metallopeptidase [Streptomyces sp. NPDC059578]|uniref:M23 family metallopeptidase n=1 Tax=Streptomyces sp. NPDC059578 TaxID=3346874 RepID=UPI0036B1B171